MKSITICVVLIAIAILAIGCTQNYASKETESSSSQMLPVIPVKVDTLEATNRPIPIYTSGHVRSQNVSKLGFKIGGVIQAIYVKEGTYVRKGQVLARLIPTEINAQMSQAKHAYEKAQRDLTRIQRLYEDTVATYENVQDLATLKEVAEANLEIAKFNQKHAVIYAPNSGRVLQKMAESGEVISPGVPVIVMERKTQQSIIEVGLTDREILRLKLGDRAKIEFDAYEGQLFQATITDIAESSDERTGLFNIEISIPSNEFNLKNGFFGKVTIFPSNQPTYYPIPLDAIASGNEALVTVFIPDSLNKVHRVSLKPYQITPNFVAVPTEKNPRIYAVITEGKSYVTEDSPIIIK